MIEKFLKKAFIVLLLLLLISQILLYNNIYSDLLNPVYEMEKNWLSKNVISFYDILRIYGNIPESNNVWILKNGIPIGQIKAGDSVYLYVFDGDIIEIDATRSSGIPYEIIIQNISSYGMSEGSYKKVVIKDKFYRMEPFTVHN